MDDKPDELLRQLEEVDAHFPQGLRNDRPYEIADTVWNGPFYGKDGPQLIRNPLTGQPTPMAPMTSPDMYLSAVNSLVEAKARARANVLRGWGAQQASTEALSRAWGVDPSQTKNLTPDVAKGVIQGNVAQRNDRREQDRLDRQDRMREQDVTDMRQAMPGIDPNAAAVASGMHNPDTMRQMFMAKLAQDNQAAEQQRIDAETAQKRSDLSAIPSRMEYLNTLDPARAEQLVPNAFAGLLERNSPMYLDLLSHYGTRAQRDQMERDQRMKAAGESAKRLSGEIDKGVFQPLAAARSATPSFETKQGEVGTLPTKAPDYEKLVSSKLEGVRQALTAAQRLIPDFARELAPRKIGGGGLFDDVAKTMLRAKPWLSAEGVMGYEPLSDPDQQGTAQALDSLADAISSRVRELTQQPALVGE